MTSDMNPALAKALEKQAAARQVAAEAEAKAKEAQVELEAKKTASMQIWNRIVPEMQSAFNRLADEMKGSDYKAISPSSMRRETCWRRSRSAFRTATIVQFI